MRTIPIFLFASLLLGACSSSGGGGGNGSSSDGSTPKVEKCVMAADCPSSVCTEGACQAATSSDGVKNGDETDIDCGGTQAPTCADGKSCVTGDDCTSKVCTSDVCQVATGTDGIQNGDESDVDCGGTTTGALRCAAGRACNVHADCQSDGCAYDKKCAVGRSCTQQFGGDTCGAGEIGDPGAVHESCCARAPLDGTEVQIDKYLVTAGRMRAFIERLNGDVVSYVSGLGADTWDQSWDGLVPANVSDANDMLGPYWDDAPNYGGVSKRSCATGQFGGHTLHDPGLWGYVRLYAR
ncbi:MAG: hypothetical protein FWD69_02995 [Polyangiaceae bacterium]|nr:hypothetical protein [Polyangiaceae bacterium]